MTTVKTTGEDRKADIKRYTTSYRDEVDGVALYVRLAHAADNAAMKDLFLKLAATEERHRDLWAEKLRAAGAEVPSAGPSWRVKTIGWLARRFGVGAVAPIVSRMEVAAMTMYDNQPEAVAAGLPAEERSHARVFRELGRPLGEEAVKDIARLEGRHRGGTGNALRAAVLGVNDGLVSTLCLVLGVAGAGPGREVVFVTGIAGLLAGAFAMAMGEWVSVKSSAEAFENQLAIEKAELEDHPEEEEDELALIYQVKGLSPEDARRTAERIIANKDTALDTLAREELGMSRNEVGNPWVAAGTSMALFAGGSFLPIIPWIFTGGFSGILFSVLITGAGLFAAGAATTLFTGKAVLFAGGRMFAIGVGAAAITFGLGTVLGASTGI